MMGLGSATAVEKQLDQLENLFNAFIIAILIVLFASAAASQDFQLFGARIETKDAHGVVVMIFDCIFLLFAHVVWKIGDLIKNSVPAETEKAVVSLFSHKWLLNPFSYCGPGKLSVGNCAIGSFLLVFSWWIGLGTLQLLSGLRSAQSRDTTDIVVQSLYPTFAIVGILASARLFKIIFSTLAKSVSKQPNPQGLRKSLSAALWAKCVSAAIATIFGCMIYYAFSHIGM